MATATQSTQATPVIGWAIEAPEYQLRLARVRQELQRRQLDGLVLFHPIRMAYVSGFFHISTERPMAIVVGLVDGLGALIAHLEEARIGKAYGVSHVKGYPEDPTGGTKHPMLHLADLLTEMGLNRQGTQLGYDSNGYLDINGYDGPLLAEVVGSGVDTIRARDIIDRLRAVKSEAELA